MKAITSIDTTKAMDNGNDVPANTAVPVSQETERAADKGQSQGKPESELRAAARRKGLNLKQLAELMGVSYGYVSQVSSGSRPWSPMLRERAMAVLGEVPGQGVVYRQGGAIQGGESTCIREQARERGMTLRQVADRTGLSYGYVVQVSRGQRHLSPAAQARMESVLEAPIKVEAAQPRDVDPQALWDRMEAHGISQNEVARRAGISVSYLSQIMNGQRTPSGPVLRRLHDVLFAPTTQELVTPVELKVMAWKKDDRKGVVVQGAGGPGADTIRTGGRVPWGAEVEFAYTSGYDSRGRLSMNHIVDERGYGAMLKQPESGEV